MQQKSKKNSLVLLILFLFPITNFLSIYRFYAGRVLLGIVRIILFITFFANERNENIMAISLLAWMAITVIDFILILFGKFKDKNKLPISSFNPKKDYEKFLAEKRIEEESKKKSEEPIKKITEQKNTEEKEELKAEAKKAPEEVEEKANEEMKGEPKEDAKEVVSEEAKKEPKEEVKEKANEEMKEEPREDAKEVVSEEVKEEATEEMKEETKEETNKESKHEANEGVKEDVEENSKEKESTGVVKGEKQEEMNEEVKEEVREAAKREEYKEVEEEPKEKMKEGDNEEKQEEMKDEAKKEIGDKEKIKGVEQEKMTPVETLKSIYEKIHPQLKYCMFAPNLDPGEWESKLRSLAEKEEPLSVICIGEADRKGMSQMLSANSFMFTTEKLYMQGMKDGILFSNIQNISYTEEKKTAVFGGDKIIGHIQIKMVGGKTEDLIGLYATKEIADFLNKARLALVENPPEKLPEVDTSHADLIAGAITNYFIDDFSNWEFKPNIPHKKLNSLIIHCLKNELKTSCAAYCKDSNLGGKSAKALYFFNDVLVAEYSGAQKFKAIKYKKLTGVSYEENESENTKKLTLFAKNNEKILCLEGNASLVEIPSEKTANFFSWLISKETGVKTEAKIDTVAKQKEEKIRKAEEIKKLEEEERSKNPILKKIVSGERDDYGCLIKKKVPITDKKDEEALKNILKKWNEIFKGNDSWEITSSVLGDDWNSDIWMPSIVAYTKTKTIDSDNSYIIDDKCLRFTKFDSQVQLDITRTRLYRTLAFAYFPKSSYNEYGDIDIDRSKALYLSLTTSESSKNRRPTLKLIMNSGSVTLEFESNDNFQYSELGIFGFPTFFDDMEAFKKKLDEIDKKHKKHLEDIENNARNEIADW